MVETNVTEKQKLIAKVAAAIYAGTAKDISKDSVDLAFQRANEIVGQALNKIYG
jgi:hypothetical protein